MRIRHIVRLVAVAAALGGTAVPATADTSYLCVDVPAVYSSSGPSTPSLRPCIPWI